MSAAARATAVGGGGLVPVIANIQVLRDIRVHNYDLATILVTVISPVVAGMEATLDEPH